MKKYNVEMVVDDGVDVEDEFETPEAMAEFIKNELEVNTTLEITSIKVTIAEL